MVTGGGGESEPRPWGGGRQLRGDNYTESGGWQGPDPPRGRGSSRPPRRKGGGSGRKGRPWPPIVPLPVLGLTAPWAHGPSPSQELSPQETNIRWHPGLPEAGGWGGGEGTPASGLLGVRRAPALQVTQVDGLEGCQGTGRSTVAQTETGPGTPIPYLPLEALGSDPCCQTASRVGSLLALRPPPSAAWGPWPGPSLPGRLPHSLFRLGLGTFSTYSSTRPRSLPDIWLRRSRSTPCQAAEGREDVRSPSVAGRWQAEPTHPQRPRPFPALRAPPLVCRGLRSQRHATRGTQHAGPGSSPPGGSGPLPPPGTLITHTLICPGHTSGHPWVLLGCTVCPSSTMVPCPQVNLARSKWSLS